MSDDIVSLMRRIKKNMPSWKGEIQLNLECYGGDRTWSAVGRDVWGHMHTPTFWSADPLRALRALDAFVSYMHAQSDLGPIPYIDDEGRESDCWRDYYIDEPKFAGQTLREIFQASAKS